MLSQECRITFFNYKKFHSNVLRTIIDARYKFVATDVGSYGREWDVGIFGKSIMGQQIDDENFNISTPTILPDTAILQRYVILAKDAFTLTTSIMKSYLQNQSINDHSKAVQNYRHSRSRRISKNAIGILCQYCRVFFTPIAITPAAAVDVLISACILQNMIRNSKIPYPNKNTNDILQFPKDNLLGSVPTRARITATQVRGIFREYFVGD
ncbi:hypothetical protein NQ314_009553 [Rhamnusium bicolor]|uniref:DDE Tnp4 domain-containing protein n=1 Tax=Rhamnusium bicolor TaxID=1586634 RepID=A0AAV8XZ17_9CUCU|nr:hypothetical protein NQ314_009553 [Rhamnusium bicolor]